MRLGSKIEVVAIAVVIVAIVAVISLWIWMSRAATEQLIEEGYAALEARDWQVALDRFQEADNRQPDSPRIRYGLLKARTQLAVRDFQQGRMQYRSTLQEIQPEVDSLPQDAPDRQGALLLKAEVAYYLNQFEKAVTNYRTVLERQEDNLKALLGLSASLYEQARRNLDHIPEAIEALQRVVQMQPNREETHRKLAELFMMQGQPMAAAEEMQLLLNKNPQQLSGLSLKTLGKWHFLRGEFPQARQMLEMATQKPDLSSITQEKDFIETRYLLGTVAFYLGDYGEARKHLRQARTSSQEEAMPLLQWSKINVFDALVNEAPEQADEELNNALETLIQAFRREPENPTVLRQLADAYIRMRMYPEARQTLRDLVEIRPQEYSAWYELGNLAHSQGDDTQAIQHYRKCLEIEPGFVPARYNLGCILLARAGYEEAVSHLEQVVQQAPDRLDARLSLAQAYQNGNRIEDAMNEYKTVISQYPNEINALIGLGMLYRRRGDIEAAEEYFGRATEVNPDDESAHVLLGQMYEQQGKVDLAIRHLERALKINPDNFPAAIRLGYNYLESGQRRDISQARELFERLTDNPNQQIAREARAGLALALMMQGELGDAQAQFDELLSLPNLRPVERAQIYVNIGNAALRRGQKDMAKRNYELALTHFGSLAEARYNLGRLLHQENKLAEARREYLLAASTNPDLVAARYNLGLLHQQAGELSQAEREYLRALEIDPTLVDAYVNLSEVYLARGQTDQAAETLQKARELDSESKRVSDALGKLYYRQQRFDQATEVLDYDDQTAQAKELLGMIAFQRGDYNRAVELLRDSLREQGTEPARSVLVNLGTALLKTGQFVQAENYLKQAVSIESRDYQTLNNLGALYVRTGRYDEAVKTFEKSLDLNGDQPGIRSTVQAIAALE